MADPKQPPQPAQQGKRGKRHSLTPQQRAERDAQKSARFRKLANMRVPAAIKRLRYVSRLGNKTTYSYTPEQATRIISALEEAMEFVKMAFAGTTPVQTGFML